MKLSVLFFILFYSFFAFSGFEALPLGGKVLIDSNEWIAKKLKTNDRDIMIFIHKENKDLQGIVLDGNPKTKESCEKKKKGKEWVICSQTADTDKQKSIQYILERKVSEKAFQTYVISFNVKKENVKAYLPVIKKFETKLESAR